MSHHHKSYGGKRTSRSRGQVGRIQFAQTFLVVCEGKCTEKYYFEAFRVAGDIRAIRVEGGGGNTLHLVEWAAELATEGDYDQIWCVFDRDSFSAVNFNRAIALAGKYRFHVAYSNEAFELWFLLHFHYYNTGITRQAYCEKLEVLIEGGYRKNDRTIYAKLLPHQTEAIHNARRLLGTYNPTRPAEDNPSTLVFELVEELNRHAPDNLRKAAHPEKKN